MTRTRRLSARLTSNSRLVRKLALMLLSLGGFVLMFLYSVHSL